MTSASCWCGSDEAARLGGVAAAQLLRCGRCGTFRVDPPPVRSNGEAVELYSHYYERDAGSAAPVTNTAGRTSRFWQVTAAVPELAQPGGRAADVGCGDGTLCAELYAAGWSDVTGFDLSRSRIRRCRERYPSIAFYDSTLGEAAAAGGAFDLIVLDNVIEHAAQPRQMVAGLAPHLTDGGRLVLITPNMCSGHFRLLGRRWTPEIAPHVHVYLFTPASIAELLEQAGLKVFASGTFHTPVSSPAQWRQRLATGDLRGLVWRAHQDLGAIYGRVIGAGPMLYAVAGRAA